MLQRLVPIFSGFWGVKIGGSSAKGANLSQAGFYLHRAQQGVFPHQEFPPNTIHISVFGFAIIFVPCLLLFMGSKVLLRWLLVNPNMKLCLSFPCFRGREQIPLALIPTPFGLPRLSISPALLLFPPQIFWAR